jgi:hypothetical protein
MTTKELNTLFQHPVRRFAEMLCRRRQLMTGKRRQS